MSTIEERVLAMKLENSQFQGGVKSTLASIDQLNKGLQLQSGIKGLEGISGAVQNISSKFSILGAVGFTVVQNLTNSLIGLGKQMGAAIMGPLVQGGQKRSLSIEQAKFQFQGLGMDVAKTMDSALQAVKGTAYGLDEAAKAAAMFGASGLRAGTEMTAALRGISGVAAMSGSDYASIADVFTKVAGQGRLMGDDLNRLASRGINAAATLGKAMKKSESEVRAMVTKGKIDFKTFAKAMDDAFGEHATKASETYTGSLANVKAALARIGAQYYTYKFQAMRDIFNALTPVVDNFAAAIKPLIDMLGNRMVKGAGNFAKSLKKINLDGLTKAMVPATEAVKNVLDGVSIVLGTVKKAFQQVFPAATPKQLMDFANLLKNLTEGFKMGGETADKVRRIFAGVFSIFGIGYEVIKRLIGPIGSIFGAIFEGSGGFVDFAARIGDWLVKVHQALKTGQEFSNTVGSISWKIQEAIRWVKEFAKALATGIVDFVKDIKLDGLSKAFENMGERFKPVTSMLKIAGKAFEVLGKSLGKVWDIMQPFAKIVGNLFAELGNAVSNALNDFDFSLALDAINTGLFATLVLLFKKFLGDFGKEAEDASPGIMDTIKGMFGGVTDSLEQMQNTLKAATLMQIAIAMGVLTAAVVALSLVDSAALTKSLTAMTVMFTQLFASMALFERIGATKGFAKMPFVTAAMIMLGIAVNILASAVKKLADLDWDELARGLTGLTVILGVLVGTMKLMPDDKRLISTGIGLTILAGAVKILATAVKDLSDLSWEEMAKGLVGVGALLASLAIFTQLTKANAGGIAQGAGLILLAVGIKILASAMSDFTQFSWEEIGRGLAAMGGGLLLMAGALAVLPPSSVLSAAAIFIAAQALSTIGDALKSMGKMKWGEIGKGLTAMGGALAIVALAIGLLPPSSLLSAAAIFVAASALGMITDALKSMSGMSWEEIGKGLVMLAGSLGIIALALAGMSGAIPGALALLVVAGALGIIGPILMAFGEMSWEEIGKGLLMLAGALTVIGVAGALLTPVIPTLLGLGAAVLLLGVGMLAAGVGVLAFSAGLTALSIAGAAGTAALVAMVTALVGLIPMIMAQIGQGIIAFAAVIATAGPQMTEAMTTVLEAIIEAIRRVTPKIIDTLLLMLTLLLNKLAFYVPKMVDAGLKLIKGVIKGFADNIGGIVDEATRLITNFIDAIGRNLPKIIQSGVDLVINFINGVADAIRNNSAAMGEAGGNLASAMVEGMIKGLGAGVGRVASAAANLARSAWNAAKAALDSHSPSKLFIKLGKWVNEGFIIGLDGGRDDIKKSFDKLGEMIKDGYDAANAAIAKHEERLKKLNKARKKDRDEIRKTTQALKDAKAERAKLAAGLALHKGQLKQQEKQLLSLAASQEKVNEKLKNAQQVLADAKKTRDDYNKSITESYSKMPDFNKDTKLVDYATELKKKINDTKAFATALQKLRERGLNDTMYKELLAKGTEALPFVQDIVSAGKAGVADLNRLGSQLQAASKSLGNTASKNLYQAAVDSAAGLVKGLQNQEKAIEKQMDKIADSMVKSIKKKLGIKSPSREFAKVGIWAIQGLAKGLRQSDPIDAAAEGVGRDAIFAMQKSLSGLSNLLDGDMDMNPTITPVLDLSDVKKDAGYIDDLLSTKALDLGDAYSMAKRALVGYENNQEAQAEYDAESQGDSLTFIQNNNSPKALSSADIYRQTKNQLSVAKEALT